MLLTQLLHPEILHALGRAGHGSRVLIADGNYPYATQAPAGAAKVFLNLRPGLLQVTDVLEVLVGIIPIESALVMKPPDGRAVQLHTEFRALLPTVAAFTAKKRVEFYASANSPDTTLVIATGEEQRFANILLTIGVVVRPSKET